MQGLAVDELHDDEEAGAVAGLDVVGADVVDGDDVGVGQPGHGLGLAQEQIGAGGGVFGVKQLDGDEAMEDGGWRVLAFERQRYCCVDILDADELKHLEARLEDILGPEWQQRIRLD